MHSTSAKPVEDARQPDFINVSRLHSIKTRIVAFAIVATILPALTLGSLAYLQITRFLNQKISQDLKNIARQVSRELDLSIKERIYDVRVFASSYLVTENLSGIIHGQKKRAGKRLALNVITDYLQSVRNKFVDYKELLIVDLQGNLVATSEKAADTSPNISTEWINTIKAGQPIIGQAYFDTAHGTRVIMIGEPVRNAADELLGMLAAKLSVRPIDSVLTDQTQSDTDAVFLINAKGRMLTGAGVPPGRSIDKQIDPQVLHRLMSNQTQPVTYMGLRGLEVIGTINTVPSLGWQVVVEMDRDKAFAQLRRLQRLTLMVAAGMLALLGLCAYLLALTIVRPLRKLSQGADRVAAGDLQVDLPVRSRSEAGYLTQIFNHMVAKLQENRDQLAAVNTELQNKNQELHLLSITDPLTGLFNRKHLMETLTAEVIRSVRHKHTFALMIIDIDHFKRINDTYGHQNGDEVLRCLAQVFRKSIRDCDYAARYGGEEFIILLPETGSRGAMEAAERIRVNVGLASVGLESTSISVTVSIGISLFPDNGEDVKSVIQQADKALYAAKDSGRNRIVPGMAI